MSWSVEGRVYHSYEEYQRARARERESRLRRTVEQLQIPRMDTSRLEREIAATEARNYAVRRLSAQVSREAAERREMVAAHRERISSAFQEVEREETRLSTHLDGWQAKLSDRLQQLEAQREAHAKAVGAELDGELEADRRSAETARRRRQDLLTQTEEVLGGLEKNRLRDLGLDATPARALLARAHQEGELTGLDLARKAYDEARGLESNAAYREARLEALREVYKAEIESLREALRFNPEDRADLVGEGSAALDAPLQRELDQLLARVEGVRYYEDHELRFADLGKVLDQVAVRVSDLASQVRDFDTLEQRRVELVRSRLGAKLKEVLGEEVRLVEVIPGELGLQPVEACFQTARGEKVDCSVYIDGTLRIHHYEHVNQASCSESAAKLAKSLPELMALNGQPRLDVAAAASTSGTAERKDTESQTNRRTL
jgi:hypothetical protein